MSDDQSEDERAAGHLTFAQLDDLAAQAAADTDPDHEESSSAAGALLQAHLDGCASCRTALGEQISVRALLRSASRPAPMPSDIAARLDAALAGARGPQTPVNVVPFDGPARRAGVLGAIAESRLTKAVVGAAAVALIGVGGYSAIHRGNRADQSSASSATSGAAPKAGTDRGAVATAARVVASGTKYTSATIQADIRRVLGSAANEPLAHPDAGSESARSTLTTPTGLAACLTALGTPGATPDLVDLATFAGKPVAVLVLPDPGGGRDIWVVSRSCTTGQEGVAFYAPAT